MPRLSTVVSCDCILVLDGGRVAESGTHDQLLAREDSLYAGQCFLIFGLFVSLSILFCMTSALWRSQHSHSPISDSQGGHRSSDGEGEVNHEHHDGCGHAHH